jgi:hypothetical protein
VVDAATLIEIVMRGDAMVDIVIRVADIDVAAHKVAGVQESTMESWVHEGACDEYGDSIQAVVEECVNAEDEDNLIKTAICEAPHQICKFGDTSVTKTRSQGPSYQVIMLVSKK